MCNLINNSIVYCILFIFVLIFLSKKMIAEEKYYLHSSVFQNISNDSLIPKVIDKWISFLYEPADSLRMTYWDKDDNDKFKEDYCLFCNPFFSQIPRETLLNDYKIKPYIISIEKRDNIYFLRTMFWQNGSKLSDTASNNQFPIGIIKVGVINRNKKLFLKNIIFDETENWQIFRINQVSFIVEPSMKIDTSECENAVKFCDSLSKLWYGTKFKDAINYFVAATPESAERLIGMDFAYIGSFNGLTVKQAKLIINGLKNFNYRHELVHLVLGEFSNKLLSEGVATYFGGSGKESYNTILKEFSKQHYPITQDKINKIFEYSGFKDYYILGALFCEQVYLVKGIEGLKLLMNTPNGKEEGIEGGSGKLLIQRICSLIEINQSELIDRINNRLK